MHVLALPLWFFGIAAQAQTNSPSSPTLFDFAVYAENSIEAECSSFDGKTASAGAVELRDFSISTTANDYGCALESASSVTWNRGSTSAGSRESCVAAPVLRDQNLNSRYQRTQYTDFSSVNREMENLSAQVALPGTRPGVRTITLTIEEHHNQGFLTLEGSASELLVVNVLEEDVSIYDYGVKLIGGISPQNILWNFPNAKSIFIAYSGNDQFGMPGTFLAPYAAVTFNNAHVTGAIFAKRVIGMADPTSCAQAQIKGGSVTSACLNGLLGGIGCNAKNFSAPSSAVTHSENSTLVATEDAKPASAEQAASPPPSAVISENAADEHGITNSTHATLVATQEVTQSAELEIAKVEPANAQQEQQTAPETSSTTKLTQNEPLELPALLLDRDTRTPDKDTKISPTP